MTVLPTLFAEQQQSNLPPHEQLESWLLGFGCPDNQTLRQLCRRLGR